MSGYYRTQVKPAVFSGLLDFAPTNFALSFRRLSVPQTLCVRVRRGGDAAELDIGFSTSAVMVSGLLSYQVDVAAILAFVAGGDNNGYISRHYLPDGSYAYQTTLDNQPQIVAGGVMVTDPTTGHIATSWSGTRYLNYPDLDFGRNVGYIQHAIVGTLTSTGTGNLRSFVHILATESSARYAVGQSSTPNRARIGARRTNGGSSAQAVSSVDHGGICHLFTGYADYENNVSVYRQDAGNQVTSNTHTSGVTSNTAAPGAYIGGNPIAGIYLTGYISEVLLWNSNAYADALTNEIEQSLATYYFGG